MRKIIVHEFITLDGVIQAPGGAEEDTDGGFPFGGWTLPYWHNDIGAQFFKVFSASGALLLGRKTWQTHGAAFDPMPAGDPFGDAMKDIHKYVVSTTLTSAEMWRNSTIIADNVIEEVRALKEQPGADILMDGSSVLIHALIEEDLIDEFQLHIYPLVLGTGKRLFPEGKNVKLELVEARALPTGVVFHDYKVAKS